MKKIYERVWEIIPTIWGMLLVAVITLGSIGVLVFIIKWILQMMGVL